MTMTGIGQRHQLSVGAFVGGIPYLAPLAMAMLLLGAGCYNPKVAPGGLRCAPPGQKSCPDGLTCVAGLCTEPGSTGNGGRGGAAGTGGMGGAGSGGAGGTCPNAIAPLCTPPAGGAGGCDPVCRTGCPCGQRCGVSTGGTACSAVVGARAVGEICTLGVDDCGPGLVCLTEPCGTNLGRCYRYCRDNSLCGPGGVCGTPVNLPDGNPSGQKVCNVGDQLPACNVYARSGCPDLALVCYISNAGTTCDCPSMVNAVEGEACSFYNDCAPGLTCLRVGGATQCHRVCRTSVDCAGGAACTLTGAFGYCP